MYAFSVLNPIPFLFGSMIFVIFGSACYFWISFISEEKGYEDGWHDGYYQAMLDVAEGRSEVSR